MRRITKVWRPAMAGLAIVHLIILTVTPAMAARNRNPGVLPVHAHAFGATYGEWAVRWSQWSLSIPADSSPIIDETGEHCAEAQSGKVWFLAGTFGGGEPIVRDCTIPAGKAVFFPLIVTTFGSAVFDCEPTVPGVVCDVPTLRAAAAATADSVSLQATLDGVPLRNLTSYRVKSPVFDLTLPDDNVLGIPSGTYAPQVSDGYWLLLAPLSAGTHTLSWRAEFTGGPFAGFTVEVTYHLTVGR